MRFKHIILMLVVLLISASMGFLTSKEAQAAGRLPQVGGFGVITYNTTAHALDFGPDSMAYQGQIVYIKGWQTGTYYINDNHWVEEDAVQPIINSYGYPMAQNVWKEGDIYYMDGQPITLPERPLSKAERFLTQPTAPVTYQGTTVPSDWIGDLIDPSMVWYSPPYPIVATLYVTPLYYSLYTYTAPSFDAPKSSLNPMYADVLTANEQQGDWYRIGDNVWIPSRWGDEVLLDVEDVQRYAPAEYYNGSKWISIDLRWQRLTAWEGDDVILNAPVKSGKYGWYTPQGTYRIFEKVPNERMSGPDYDLLDVAWTQYFTYSRIGIHAAYWHYNYNGRPGSHGCINTPEDKAEKLFMWSPVGTTVVTHNEYIFDEADIEMAGR
jgi:hypothetical protein